MWVSSVFVGGGKHQVILPSIRYASFAKTPVEARWGLGREKSEKDMPREKKTDFFLLPELKSYACIMWLHRDSQRFWF